MQHAVGNTSRKIWVLMDSIVTFNVIRDKDQQLTLKLENQELGATVIVTLVYTKCT